MKLTGRGRKTVLSMLILGAFSLSFLDWILVIPLVAVLGIISYDYLSMKNAKEELSQQVEIEPPEIEAELTAGETHFSELSVDNNSELPLKLRCELDSADVFPDIWLEGNTRGKRDLSFNPDL